MEEKLKVGEIFETRVLNYETNKVDKKYYKTLSLRQKNPVSVFDKLLGFRVKEYKYVKTCTALMPVKVYNIKELKLVDIY